MDTACSGIGQWFAARCDGAWEHEFGIRIETLDNPGWKIEIDLKGTPYFNKVFDDVDIERTKTDWVLCRVCNGKFEGFGGAKNLEELLQIFLLWLNG